MKKLDLKKIVEAMKPAKDEKRPLEKAKEQIGSIRVRDMRQEARELGSHGAEEYFKDGQV